MKPQMEDRTTASAYTEILLQLERRSLDLAAVVADERRAAEPLLAELLAAPPGRWAGRVRSRAAFRTFPFAARLLEASCGHAPHEPRRAEAMSRLALDILGSLDPAKSSETAVADSSAQAWAVIGYCLGLRKRWARAEQAFRVAQQTLRTPESVEAGALCRLLAAVRRGQTRYIEALALTEHAARLCEEAGDERGAQAATELGAEVYVALGEIEKGLAQIARARQIDRRLLSPALDWEHQARQCKGLSVERVL